MCIRDSTHTHTHTHTHLASTRTAQTVYTHNDQFRNTLKHRLQQPKTQAQTQFHELNKDCKVFLIT